MRLAASIRNKSLKPSAILRKLGAYRQQNRLYLALGEIGRIERTLFMLDWIENADLRMECQAGLNKGESRHSLARAVFAHSQGRIRDRSDAAQQKRAMALNLVIAAIILEYQLHGQGCQPSCEDKCNVRSDPLAVHVAARVVHTSSCPGISTGILVPQSA